MKKKTKNILIGILIGTSLLIAYNMFTTRDKKEKTTPIPPVTQEFDVSSLNNQLVLIKHTAQGLTNYGSGVVISTDLDKTYILTNAHVIENGGSIEVINNSLQVTATVVSGSINHEYDMVILSIPRNDFLVPVTFANDYSVGSLVLAAGYHNTTYDINAGLITSINNDRINSSARIAAGQSGSGLFNSEMQLVGLNKQYVVDVNNQWLSTISIKVETILEYIEVHL